MIDAITLDLPVPPSVNRTRMINWRSNKALAGWLRVADSMIMCQYARGLPRVPRIPRFALDIVLSEAHTRIDMDNILKNLVDYLRRIEVIEDDSPKCLRELHVSWGDAPEGVRVTVRPCQ